MQGRRAQLAALVIVAMVSGAPNVLAEPREPASAPSPTSDAAHSWLTFWLQLKPGSEAVLLVDGDHNVRIGSAQGTAGQTVPPAPRGLKQESFDILHVAAPPAPANSLDFALFVDPKDGSRLRLFNHLNEPVIYALLIRYTVRGQERSEPTTICSVGANKGSLEAWPQELVDVVITGVYAAPSNTVCGFADQGRLGPPPTN